jgi:2-oxoglutarate ferredoxin oxidoreductase subunit alpha
MDRLRREEGIDLQLMQLVDIWPFPDQAVSDILRTSRQVVVVENNFTGQMANLIRQQTGVKCAKVVKYNGVPFSPKELHHRLKELIMVSEKISA